MKKDEIGGIGWMGWMERNAGRGEGDGENSFGEAGTSSTSAPRDPEPPLFYYYSQAFDNKIDTLSVTTRSVISAKRQMMSLLSP
ncbi:hypothetical protein TNCV_1805531 [Trichonephila clavipes]|nr:hypothetical protein TNCV_1805531 [Trichonephila clavipes]